MLLRRLAVLILALSLSLCPLSALAAEEAAPGSSGVSAEDSSGAGEDSSDPEDDPYALPDVSCSSYAVISEETGQVLIEKNGSDRAYPASTTKIMTMGLTLDSGIGMETVLTTSREAVAEIYSDSTQLYLAVGEEMTVRDLLYGAQVRSANDGANVLAEGVSGSLERFASLMNDKARELGLEGTHFVNAHGLPDDDHYTTAIDLARITRWALSVDGFAQIFSAYTYTIPATNVAGERPMTTTCDILNPSQAGYYEYATGAKLGWTVASQYTLSTAAERDGLRLICVVMGDATDTALYADTAALLDYCFDFFREVDITPQLSRTTVPVYNNTNRTGDIEITSRKVTVLLHETVAESDVVVSEQLPDAYDASGEIEPSVSLALSKESAYQYAGLGEFSLEYEEHPLNGYETVRATVLDISEQKRPLAELIRELAWVVVPVGTLLIVLLVSLLVQLSGRKDDRVHRRSKYE